MFCHFYGKIKAVNHKQKEWKDKQNKQTTEPKTKQQQKKGQKDLPYLQTIKPTCRNEMCKQKWTKNLNKLL